MFHQSINRTTGLTISTVTEQNKKLWQRCRSGDRNKIRTTQTQTQTQSSSSRSSFRTKKGKNGKTKPNGKMVGTKAIYGADDIVDVTVPIATFGGLFLGYLIAKIVVYVRLQIITAQFLDLRISRVRGEDGDGKARVLEFDCGNAGRNLYYYPKNTKFVIYKGPDINQELLGQISVQAERAVQIEKVAYDQKLSNIRDQSIDCVVSTGALTKAIKEKGRDCVSKMLDESFRMLKSDGEACVILVEPRTDELCALLLESSSDGQNRVMFNKMEVDEKWETLPLFPYLIGTMTKRTKTMTNDGDNSKPKSELQSIRSNKRKASRSNNK
jgi:ubiquinone/menaquinone biosynthesis C-methylase UbiE